MKYYCKVCDTSLKYKTPRGWTEHIRGNSHKEKAASALHPSSLMVLRNLKATEILTKTEYDGILAILDTSPSRAQAKSKILALLNNSLCDIPSKHDRANCHTKSSPFIPTS